MRLRLPLRKARHKQAAFLRMFSRNVAATRQGGGGNMLGMRQGRARDVLMNKCSLFVQVSFVGPDANED